MCKLSANFNFTPTQNIQPYLFEAKTLFTRIQIYIRKRRLFSPFSKKSRPQNVNEKLSFRKIFTHGTVFENLRLGSPKTPFTRGRKAWSHDFEKPRMHLSRAFATLTAEQKNITICYVIHFYF